MPELDPTHKADLAELGEKQRKRAENFRLLRFYTRGNGPIPDAIREAGVTKAYRLLMPMSDAPWASVILEAVDDRLEVSGVHTGDDELDKALWGEWRRNGMDSESSLAHQATLTGGRSYAIVWPDENGEPEIVLESDENVIVKYAPGSRRRRVVAMRHWIEGETPYATLYYPDGIYKFKGPKSTVGSSFSGIQWERHQPDEDRTWPVRNPYRVVPVVEIATNRQLEPGCYPFARGEFEHCIGVIDRINLLTFLGLVVAFWMGFPLRGVIGEKIIRDDDGNPLPPFDVNADSMFQLEDPQAKLAEFKAADRGNLSITAELEQLATVSNTPRHYFPMASAANISADTVVAWESGLHGKIATRHKPQIGSGWEEIFRLIARMKDGIEVPTTAAVQWVEHESRSLAERADAAVKLKDLLPWQALAEKVLGATGDDIARWQVERGSDAFGQILAAAQKPMQIGQAVPLATDGQPAN